MEPSQPQKPPIKPLPWDTKLPWERAELPSDDSRDNVLYGVMRRVGLPSGVPGPIRDPRLINVTFRVDDLTLNYARGRAVVEGTSINALVCRLLEDYSGYARPPGREISRRIPMFRERRIRPIEGVDDL